MQDFLNFTIANTSGTNHPHISWESLIKLIVPLYNLNEQQEAVEILQKFIW